MSLINTSWCTIWLCRGKWFVYNYTFKGGGGVAMMTDYYRVHSHSHLGYYIMFARI